MRKISELSRFSNSFGRKISFKKTQKLKMSKNVRIKERTENNIPGSKINKVKADAMESRLEKIWNPRNNSFLEKIQGLMKRL